MRLHYATPEMIGFGIATFMIGLSAAQLTNRADHMILWGGALVIAIWTAGYLFSVLNRVMLEDSDALWDVQHRDNKIKVDVKITTEDGKEFVFKWSPDYGVQPEDMIGKPLTFGAYKATIESVAYIVEEHE